MRRAWTAEEIIAAMERWAEINGNPPTLRDWNPSTHLPGGPQMKKFRSGRYPNFNQVVRAFGSWNKAIAAAGFEPRAGW